MSRRTAKERCRSPKDRPSPLPARLLWAGSLLLCSVLLGSQSPAGTQTAELFIDDEGIEAAEGLERVLHAPVRHPENPVLQGSEPWEKWTVEVNGRPALYDPELGLFRLWYVSPLIDEGAGYGELHRTCYAVSADAVHWTKPELDQVEWEGSRRNNLIPWGESWMRRPSVILDPQDPDPSRRFKMTFSDLIGGRTAIVKAYSADGIHWRLNGDRRPWFRSAHNSDLMGWDPRLRRYVLFVRMPGSPTSVGRSTSDDFITWSEPVTVLAPGPADHHLTFNGLAAFLYQGLYLGTIRVYHRVPDRSLRSYDVELASSRDGVRWNRVSPGTSFFPPGDPGAWDSHSVILPAPVVQGDKIWFFYSGQNHPGGKEGLRKVQAGWVDQGVRRQTAIGVATLSRDRFVSLDAGSQTGRLTTKPVTISGETLEVNADVRGELRVELLDESGAPIAGFQADDCRPVRSDALDHKIHWNGESGLGPLRGRVVRLRFLLREGSLYSYSWRVGG